jgi:hypothetical protein
VLVHPRDLDERPSDFCTACDPVDEQSETAKPIHVVDSTPLTLQHDTRLISAHVQEDVESFADRRRRLMAKPQKALRSSSWRVLVLVLFAFNVAVIGARQELVLGPRFAGQPAPTWL